MLDTIRRDLDMALSEYTTTPQDVWGMINDSEYGYSMFSVEMGVVDLARALTLDDILESDDYKPLNGKKGAIAYSFEKGYLTKDELLKEFETFMNE